VRLVDGKGGDAVLWDLRVHATSRGMGVGAALFQAAAHWATGRGCRRLMVETQNINVPACRLYAGQGCRLERAEPGAYSELPTEVRLIWAKSLTSGT
jgi:GNAT superfamily N-acetyltransferase